jgi:hypothetical protein
MELIKFNDELPNDGKLQLSPIQVREDYLTEWNWGHSQDFMCLTKGGELLRPTLYRKGGLNEPKIGKDKYFLLLKHVEAIYDYDFIKRCYPNKNNKELELQRKHLESRWCIIDENGVEKKEFKQFQTPYLKGGCIYSVDNECYNIETGEHYGSSSSSFESKDYLFLNNRYSKDKTKEGVMKINKLDGTWELFPL